MQPSLSSSIQTPAVWRTRVPWMLVIALLLTNLIAGGFLIYLANRTGSAEYELGQCEVQNRDLLDKLLAPRRR